jgi:signal transduction histidine kinase
MEYLPGLRYGSDRWWLPCSLTTLQVLGELLLHWQSGSTVSAGIRQRLHQAISDDPPLLIYAGLNWSGDRVSPLQLVDWLVDQLANRLADGDAFLGAPTAHPDMVRRWNRLRDHYRTLPLQRWLQDASAWLEVSGPKVPDSWRERWPTLDEDKLVDETDVAYSVEGAGLQEPPTSFLQQLARRVQHHRSLEAAFNHRLHKTKMSAVRQLAYGLSHEINNPLANISTRAQQLQRGEEDPARVATLQRIIDQVYRAHEMIADLMFYANPPAAKPVRVQLSKLVESVVDAYREESTRQAIRLEVRVPAWDVEIKVDPSMIGEAMGALIRNSLDAIGCQGTIMVTLHDSTDHCTIQVADSGPGLSLQARQHAFDPYFSGREAGRGLGLGLCRAYRICQLHHGEILLGGGPVGCIATILLRKSPSVDVQG